MKASLTNPLKRLVRGSRALRRLVRGSRALHRLIMWYFRRPRLPENQSAIKLHLGCGPVNVPGFINIDVVPGPNIHYVRDIRSGRLWKQNSADLIYASHVLEHVPKADVANVLRHWHSFLKPGGVLRLSVPDFDVLHDHYIAHRDLDFVQPPLMGGQFNEHDFHFVLFNRDTLEKALVAAGFANVRSWSSTVWRGAVNDWSVYEIMIEQECRPISLNLEAVK